MTHWTTGSPEDFAFFVSADFMTQIELKLEQEGMEKKKFASLIGVEPSRVSQLLHNPGNLQMDTMAKCTRALGMKMAIVVYEDGDTQNLNGPISGDIFRDCWKKMHQPKNAFDLEDVVVTRTYSIPQQSFYRRVEKTPCWTLRDKPAMKSLTQPMIGSATGCLSGYISGTNQMVVIGQSK